MTAQAEIEVARAACDKAAADVQKAVETMQAAERILARRMGLWEDAYRHLSALVAGELAGVGVSQYLAARDAATRERERANRAEAERDRLARILAVERGEMAPRSIDR